MNGAPLSTALEAEPARRRLAAAGMRDADAAAAARLLVRSAAALVELGVDRGAGAVAYWVPGRVEFLGKHTDYAGGRTMVAPAARGIALIAVPRGDRRVTFTDAGYGERFDFEMGPELAPVDAGWRNYPVTVARRVARNFPGADRGADIALASNLPRAAGMSSSSALMIATFLGLAAANDLAGRAEFGALLGTREALAVYLATVENGSSFGPLAGDRGVGTQGGSEDHTGILCGRAGSLLRCLYAPLEVEGRVALPDGYLLAFASSGVRAEKTGAARDRYNRAAQLMREVTAAWNAATGRADESVGAALRIGAATPEQLRQVVAGTPIARGPGLVDRLDHFLAESEEIVPAADAALRAGRLAELGEVVDRSQALAERLLGNQVPETAHLAGAARAAGAAAASGFGAGFGGSVWALVPEADAEPFLERWRADYRQAFPGPAAAAEFFLSPPGPSAMRLLGSTDATTLP